MAYELDIRFRCRTHYEMYGKNLKEINNLESVPVSTLSEWKNDDREEYGGIWIQNSRKDEIGKVAKMLQDEIIESQTYKDLKENLRKRHGVTTKGELEFNSGIQIKADPRDIQAKIEADTLMLGALGIDYFNNALINNAILSQTVLQNQVQKDITRVKQADIKASSEIIKIAKEARYGKDPDTINHFTVQVGKIDYTPEELKNMNVEQLEKVLANLEKKVLEGNVLVEEEGRD
jgi:hypothetical protein